jgi:hypothetical protein
MHELEVIDRHLLVRLDSRRALVDTGSPFDIGRGRATSILDEPWCPPTTHSTVLDAASAHLGIEIDWLIGYPTLIRYRLLLDWSARAATFDRAAVRLVGAAALPLSLSPAAPVPLVEIAVVDAKRHVRAVLDSGAALSYAPRAAVAGRPPQRTERDFHPMIGTFETDVWTLAITVGGRAITLEAGVLPPAIARVVPADGWILGSDFFRDRAVLLSYPDQLVFDGAGGARLE